MLKLDSNNVANTCNFVANFIIDDDKTMILAMLFPGFERSKMYECKYSFLGNNLSTNNFMFLDAFNKVKDTDKKVKTISQLGAAEDVLHSGNSVKALNIIFNFPHG